MAVPPLSLVWPGPAHGGSEAEALFVDRATASDPGFAAAPRRSARCARGWTGCRWRSSWPRRAARRWASMACWPGSTITCGCWRAAARRTNRHRSLRAVIDWSHDLLDADERVMFRRAGVFTGGFDLDAAVGGLRRTAATAAWSPT